jgi:pimeloyl-ACP methyl ester carboxylesterase
MKSPIACRRSLFTLAAALLLICAAPVHADQADKKDSSVVESASRAVVRGAAEYRFRRWLRNRIWEDLDEARYGLQFDKDWQAAAKKAPERPLVVIVHGFNSSPARNAAVMEAVRTAGYPCGSFAYPNDWDLRESAALLSRQLNEFAEEHPKQGVALVTHSMGGLVARACVEDEDLDPGNVTRLVMIAPPSHGTLLAQVAVATDVWEHWIARSGGGCWTRWRDSVIDGLGEAADDLKPQSDFLAELNARPRNPEIRYALFLGTGASVSQDEMDWIRAGLQKTGGRCPGLKGCTGKLDGLLEDMEELVDGKGDGVVAVKRGRLDGVEDVVLLPFGHLSCTGKADSEAVQQMQEELLARLR